MPDAINALIEAALAHAADLRKRAESATDEYSARTTIAEAERWEKLAAEASNALAMEGR